MSHCPSREQLTELLVEGADRADLAGVEAHLQTCARCRETLGRLTPMVLARTVAGHEPDPYATIVDPGQTTADALHDPYSTIADAPAPPRPPHDPFQTTADLFAIPAPHLRGTGAAAEPERTIADPFATTADALRDPYATTADALRDPYATTADALRDPYATTADIGGHGPDLPRPSFGGTNRSAVGRVIADFEILAELGRGGMGVVYKARQRQLNRLVALKMIRGDHEHPEHLARFRIEAESVARLHHPNILQIYDIGEAEGYPYVSLELLEGGSLGDRLKGTPQPGRVAAEWMVPLALGVEAAHLAGIVHRDLKPANVLFSKEGVPKITDFGLAKRLEAEEGQTQTGQVMGTPSYMAPEQARGLKDVGPAADVYALGAILYELLTGRPPFKGPSPMDTVRQVIDGEPVPPSRLQNRVPRDLETICLKCLDKEPRKRYPRAQDLADDLTRYVEGKPIRARPTPLWERAVKWVRRRPTTASLLAVGTVLTIGLLFAGLRYHDYRKDQERRTERAEAKLQVATADDLVRAQDALSKHDEDRARLILSNRLVTIENNPRLASQAQRARNLLDQVERQLADEQEREKDQAKFRQFLSLRDDALFQDTQFTGLALPLSLELTRKAAEAALDVFAGQGRGDDWTLDTLPRSLSAEEQTEIRNGCYELILVLAEAVATQDPKQADRALRILERADALRPQHTRAYELRKAACLARKGDRDGEARARTAADRIPPGSAFDHFLSGQQEYKRKHWDEAIRSFETALRLKPNHFWSEALLAICYLQTPRVAEAKPYLNACLQTKPEFTWLYLLRGYASGQIAARDLKLAQTPTARTASLKKNAEFEFEEAERDFQDGEDRLRRAPDDDLHYVLLVNRGLIRFQRSRLDQAATDFREAVKLKPDHFQAYAELAHVYERQSQPEQALAQIDRAIKLRPQWSPLYRGRAEVTLGRTDSTPSQREEARRDLEQAIAFETPGNRMIAQDHFQRGILFYRDHRDEEALAACESSLKVVPDYPEALRLRVRLLLDLKRYDETLSACEEALSRGKPSAVLYELRGLARAGRQDYAAAAHDYTRSLDLHPDQARVLNLRGWAYLLSDAPKLALQDFTTVLKLEPSNGEAYNGRGNARVLLGDHRAAVLDAAEAVRHGSATPRVVYNAARVYAQAAALAATEVEKTGAAAVLLTTRYQDRAVALVREAWRREPPENRARFWRETVLNDPALRTIARRLRTQGPPTGDARGGPTP